MLLPPTPACLQVHIAERHLIPRLLTEHGLHQGQLVFPPGAGGRELEGLRVSLRACLFGGCLGAAALTCCMWGCLLRPVAHPLPPSYPSLF